MRPDSSALTAAAKAAQTNATATVSARSPPVRAEKPWATVIAKMALQAQAANVKSARIRRMGSATTPVGASKVPACVAKVISAVHAVRDGAR